MYLVKHLFWLQSSLERGGMNILWNHVLFTWNYAWPNIYRKLILMMRNDNFMRIIKSPDMSVSGIEYSISRKCCLISEQNLAKKVGVNNTSLRTTGSSSLLKQNLQGSKIETSVNEMDKVSPPYGYATHHWNSSLFGEQLIWHSTEDCLSISSTSSNSSSTPQTVSVCDLPLSFLFTSIDPVSLNWLCTLVSTL